MRSDFIIPDKRYCSYCGKELERKYFSNTRRYEDVAVFLNRKYCDRKCMRKGFLKTGKHENRTESNTRTTARLMNELILKRNKCELCGKQGKLDVHHIDKNPYNNVDKNLMILCRSCHMKIHNPKKICKVTGCNNLHKGLGFCEKHYQRYKKYGSPYIVKRNTRHTKFDADVNNMV